MRAEILSIGDELLKGKRINTNATAIAVMLGTIGIPVRRVVACQDEPDEIVEVCSASLKRSEAVLVTGGLGPTRDDRTRQAICQMLGRGLQRDPDAYARLERRLQERGIAMNPVLEGQAMIIDGAIPVPNTNGTAAGMIIPCGPAFNNHMLILMPGVPSEMRAMMEQYVIPFLQERSGHHICHTTIRTLGIGEVALSTKVAGTEEHLPAGTTLAYLPHSGGVDLVITTIGADAATVAADNAAVVTGIMETAAAHVYTIGSDSLEEIIVGMLIRQGLRIAVAESCTGGLIASRLTDVAGSSATLLQGIVAYSNEAKEQLLGVRRATLEVFGAVSEETAGEMAAGALALSGADIAVATTGIAGPGGGTPAKPVGTLCFAIASRRQESVLTTRIIAHADTRLERKERFSTLALHGLWKQLQAEERVQSP